MEIDFDARLDEINAVKDDIRLICERLRYEGEVLILREFDMRLLMMKDKELTQLIEQLYKDTSDESNGTEL